MNQESRLMNEPETPAPIGSPGETLMGCPLPTQASHSWQDGNDGVASSGRAGGNWRKLLMA